MSFFLNLIINIWFNHLIITKRNILHLSQKSEEAIIEFPKENVPEDMKLEPGMSLTLSNQAGQPVPVVVMEVKEDVIVLDANHFLAGQELVFDIELVELVSQ